jgi:hypothetical protein
MRRLFNQSFRYMPEYAAIASHYGDSVAERSRVPLMAHIDEGCEMLSAWGQDLATQRAFCIHPLVQNQISFCGERDPQVMELAKEYARVANSYLCRRETDIITDAGSPTTLTAHLGPISQPVAWMLLADKLQNQKDFRIHHWFRHERRHQLERYFALWIETLRTHYLPYVIKD